MQRPIPSRSGRPRASRSFQAGAAGLAGLVLLASQLTAPSSQAAPATLRLDPALSRVGFEVDSTLHRIEGTARLVSGEIHFDTSGGPAQGRIVVDARSAETGNGLRDGALHEDLLESERFPTIVFTVERIEPERIDGDEGRLRVHGRMTLHGGDHALAVPTAVRVAGDRRERLEIDARFPVPYVAWGLEDPSNFLLSVDEVVQVHIEAVGDVAPPLP